MNPSTQVALEWGVVTIVWIVVAFAAIALVRICVDWWEDR